MNAKQFAWVYLLESGYSDVHPSYYGGYHDLYGDYISRESMAKLNTTNKEKILKVGVDWNTTNSPISDRVSEFTSTFEDSDVTEKLIGTLMLKDGTSQEWIADSITVTNIFEMMAVAASGQETFNKLFGE